METTEGISFLDTLMPFVAIVFIIAVGVVLLTQQFRKNLYKQQLQQNELKNRHQQEMMLASIQAQEEERKRIARDMHDELGATLSITRMHLLQTEKKFGAQNSELMAELVNIRQLTETSLGNMRQLSHQLMPPQLESFGLVKTLEALASQLNRAGQMEISLQHPENLPQLEWPLTLTLYRIISELINNTLKHSGAKKISIQITSARDAIHVDYSDDGKGLQEQAEVKGIGLRSIEGRVNAMGGSFVIVKSINPGFNAVITVPLVL